MQAEREHEVKLDLAAGAELPDVTKFVDRSARVEHDVVELTSTYFDTETHRLLRHRATLRRREGADDVGWQLKVPTGAARTELRLPPTAGRQVPKRLRTLVTGLAVGERLAPVAIVETRRKRARVYDGERLLVEIADDEVRATALGAKAGAAAEVATWREVEVELGDADARLLSDMAKRLRQAGATESPWPSKLARTLGWVDPVESAPRDACGLIARYLSEQLIALGSGDVALRRGLNSVHKTRVAARRARSVLRIFSAALLEQDEAGHLDEELSWYQDLLGEVRDRQVQRARFAEALSDLAPELVLGPVAATFEQALLSEQVVAREQVDAALRSERYLQLMATLTRWTDHPPVKPGVGADDLLAMAEKARRKARRRLKAALASEDPALLHRARKAAKRARYATELTRPAAGAKAKKQIKRYKRVQDVLGEHQDSTIAAGIAKRLGAADGPLRGHNGFSYGLLYAREQDAAAAARAKAYALRVPSG